MNIKGSGLNKGSWRLEETDWNLPGSNSASRVQMYHMPLFLHEGQKTSASKPLGSIQGSTKTRAPQPPKMLNQEVQAKGGSEFQVHTMISITHYNQSLGPWTSGYALGHGGSESMNLEKSLSRSSPRQPPCFES